MRILEATVGVNVRRSDGNYGHDEKFVSLKAALESGDDVDAVVRELQAKCVAAAEAGASPRSSPPAAGDVVQPPPSPAQPKGAPALGLVRVRVTGQTYDHKDALRRAGLKWNQLTGDAAAWEGYLKPTRVPALRALHGITVQEEPEEPQDVKS